MKQKRLLNGQGNGYQRKKNGNGRHVAQMDVYIHGMINLIKKDAIQVNQKLEKRQM